MADDTFFSSKIDEAFNQGLLYPMSQPKDMYSFRVPVGEYGTEYHAFVEPFNKRIFTEGTIPSFMLGRLTMIKANYPKPSEELPPFIVDMYISPDVKYKDVGWRITSNLSIMVMDIDELNSIIGRQAYRRF